MKYLYYKYLYQKLMKFAHKHDWHKMEKNPYLEQGKTHYWCHWCGLRSVTEEATKRGLRVYVKRV